MNNKFNKTIAGGAKRDSSLDVCAGFLMIITIMLHAQILDSSEFSLMHIFMFYMPWFFFKSGMFHKTDQNLTKDYIIRIYKRLVIPFLFFLLISALSTLLYMVLVGEIGIKNYIVYYVGKTAVRWFVEVLVIVRVLFCIVPKSRNKLMALLIFLYFGGVYINCNNIDLPLLLLELPLALFYYGCGYMLRNTQNYTKLKVLALTILYAALLFVYPSKVDMRMQSIIFGFASLAIIGNVIGIVWFNGVVKILSPYIPRHLEYIGKESLSYYLLHFPIIVLLEGIFENYCLFVGYRLVIVAMVLIIIPVVNDFMNRMKIGWLMGR